MGSLSLFQKKSRTQSGGWGGWGTVTAADWVRNTEHFVVYSATLSLGSSELMTGCSVSTNFAWSSLSGGSHPATLHCYLYTSDPTAGNPTSPPGSYIAHSQIGTDVPYQGIYVTFRFSGLNISSGSRVYFWFTDDNSSSNVDFLYSYATGNQYTDTPSCAGTFAAAAKSLTVSPKTVSTGGSITVTVGNGAGQSLTAQVRYGGTVLASVSFSSGVCSIPCPASWFDTAGVTLLTSMGLSVTITGTNLAESFTLNAGDDMRPRVAAPAFSPVQTGNAAALFPDKYIANISRVKAAAAVTAPTRAAIRSVTLQGAGSGSVQASYNGTSGKWEATTLAPITGDILFTVTATDERGLTGSAHGRITGVVPYTLPTANIDAAGTYRCDGEGNKVSGGDHYRVLAYATWYAALEGNSLKKFTCRLKDLTPESRIESGVASVLTGTTDPKKAYVLTVSIQDQLSGEISKEFTLDSITRNVVVRRGPDGTHVGVGMTPQIESGPSSIELPAGGRFLAGGYPPDEFLNSRSAGTDGSSFNKDFLAVDTEDPYSPLHRRAFFNKPAETTEWKNMPAFMEHQAMLGMREVIWLDSGHILVRLTGFFGTNPMWINYYTVNAWSGWYRVQATTQGT